MNMWYMHPFTHVLQLASAVPKGAAVAADATTADSGAGALASAAAALVPYQNTRAWEQRGWCFFEGCASALVKHHYCLWDDRFYDASHAGTSHALAPTIRRGSSGVPMMPERLDGLRQALRAGRRAPLSPTAFAEEMGRRVDDGSLAFTSSKADKDLVIGLYRTGFVAAFDTYPIISHGHNIISFFGLDFGSSEKQAANLAMALAYVARHCTFPHGPVRISCEGNGFSPKSQAVLRKAVNGCDGIEELYVGYVGSRDAQEPHATTTRVGFEAVTRQFV